MCADGNQNETTLSVGTENKKDPREYKQSVRTRYPIHPVKQKTKKKPDSLDTQIHLVDVSDPLASVESSLLDRVDALDLHKSDLVVVGAIGRPTTTVSRDGRTSVQAVSLLRHD